VNERSPRTAQTEITRDAGTIAVSSKPIGLSGSIGERFPGKDNPSISENEAFRLSDKDVRALYEAAYEKTSALYYHGRPPFGNILALITEWAPKL
jgi:hypothetical protein